MVPGGGGEPSGALADAISSAFGSLDDLKAKLIGVVVAIIAVVFLGVLVDATDANDIMMIGIGAGAVVIGLAAFTYATRKEPGSKPQQP